MARTLKIRKPNAREMRRLHEQLQHTEQWQVRRRALTLLHYADGLNAVEIAHILRVHVNTTYADLRAFAQQGLRCLHPLAVGGAPPRLSTAQQAEIVRWAQTEPISVGLPYGRWSLPKLRDFLVDRAIVKRLSLEWLRQLLKKRGFSYGVYNANYVAMTRNGAQFWHVFAGCLRIYRPTGSYSFSM